MSRLTKYDLHTIQTLFEEKRWRGTVNSLKNKKWHVRSINSAIKRFENTGSNYRKEESVRPITVYTTENQMEVEILTFILRQKALKK